MTKLTLVNEFDSCVVLQNKPLAKKINWVGSYLDDGSLIEHVIVYESETLCLHEYIIYLTRREQEVFYCAFLDDQYKVGYAYSIELIQQMCQEDFQQTYDNMGQNYAN